MTQKSKNAGFTLIELLVVVAIIGVLASVVMVSLNGAREKSRDAKRFSEIRQLEIALELYITDMGVYPPHDAGSRVASSLTELVPDYIASLPIDPTEGDSLTGYRYARNETNQYTILVRFETDSNLVWCGLSKNGGHPTWTGASWYREVTSSDCDF